MLFHINTSLLAFIRHAGSFLAIVRPHSGIQDFCYNADLLGISTCGMNVMPESAE